MTWDTPRVYSGYSSETTSSIPNLHFVREESLIIPADVDARIRQLPYGGSYSAAIYNGYRKGNASFFVRLVNDSNKLINLDKHTELLFILICFVIFRDCGKSDFQEVALRIALGIEFTYSMY